MAQRNLKSLLSGIGSLIENDPPVVDVREERANLVAGKYDEVNGSQEWLNMQKEVDYYLFANRTETTTGFTVSVTNGTHEIVFSGAMGTSLTNPADFLYNAGGMTFEDSGGATYTITRFTSTTTALLSDAYRGVTNAAMDTWTIRADRFYLPVDCFKALGFIDRDHGLGRLIILDRRLNEQMFGMQPQDVAGTVYWLVDDDEIYDRAPGPGFTVTDDTAAGTISADSVYEVCYTFVAEGREGPPSVPVRVTTSSAGSHRLKVDTLENTSDGGLATGIYKRIYVRQLTKGTNQTTNNFYTKWVFATQVTESNTGPVLISAFPNANPSAGGSTLFFANGRKYMRTQWVPGSDYTIRLRYQRFPNRLVADADMPEWPSLYHDILLYGVAYELGLKMSIADNKLERWRREYERLLAAYKASGKVNVPDGPAAKQMRVIGGRGPIPFLTRGPVVGDYNG